MKAIITLLAAAATTALTFTAAQAQANPPGIRLDHYHCYRVSPVTRFRPLRVRLVDQFGRLQPTLVREQLALRAGREKRRADQGQGRPPCLLLGDRRQGRSQAGRNPQPVRQGCAAGWRHGDVLRAIA